VEISIFSVDSFHIMRQHHGRNITEKQWRIQGVCGGCGRIPYGMNRREDYLGTVYTTQICIIMHSGSRSQALQPMVY